MIPKPGDVLNYAYLWDYERKRGQDEGLKERPSVVVLTVSGPASKPVISVCPVTSQPPAASVDYVEMPANVKLRLGLTDRDRSFVVTTEINRFIWPGPDIRPFDRQGRLEVCFGQIPARLLNQIKASLIDNIHQRRLRTTSRDE